MNPTTVKTIFYKEILDTLRDKRTLIAMIGVPVVLYPALFLVMTQVAFVRMAQVDETPSKVAVVGDEAPLVREWIEGAELVELVEPESDEPEIVRGEVDAVVSATSPVASNLESDGTVNVEVRFDSTITASREAESRLEKIFDERSGEILQARLRTRNLELSFVEPIKVEDENVAPPAKSLGMAVGVALPLMMVVMLCVGAFYPAVDLTAGEKERGTFETLLSTPTSKVEIVCGKFLAVFTLAMATGFLNLLSMSATILFQLRQITSRMEDTDRFEAAPGMEILYMPPEAVLAMAAILVPLAFFISAAMMSVALLAKSFKEAQNYVSPFFLVILLPAMIAMVPDIELGPATQFIPIGNICLLFRDLMMDQADPNMVFVVFLVTAVYAVLALVVATWMFQREDVILAEDRGLPLSFRRSDFKPREAPSLGMSFGLFGLTGLLLFYIGSYVQSRDLQIGLLVTEYGLLLAPVLLIFWYAKIDLKKALNLRPVGPATILGAVLMPVGAMPLLIHMSVMQNRVLPVPPEFEEVAQQLFDLQGATWGVPLLIFVIALSPAICEEVLFRGALVSGFKNRLSDWGVIVLVGVLFGLFHMSIYRFLPTGVTGMMLTYAVVKTGSIYPGIIGHFIVNGSSVLLQTGSLPQPILDYLQERQVDQNGLPITVLLVSAAVLGAGAWLIHRSRPKTGE